MISFLHVQVQHLRKEIPSLLVVQVAKLLFVVGVVINLDVGESLLKFSLANRLNTLLVVVKYYR